MTECAAGTSNCASSFTSLRQYFRRGFFTDGRQMIREYPREAPEGEQMDFVEAMTLDEKGLLQRRGVYWGWRGVKVIREDKCRS